MTPVTRLYPLPAVQEALKHISSQGLWLLLSLDHYGWRAEYDAMRVLLSAGNDGHSHYEEHAPVIAQGLLFALVDKLWRLVFAVRAHQAGGEFLNETDGYLAGGYNLARQLRVLEAITADEWRRLLTIPEDPVALEHMASEGADADEIARRLTFAHDLPELLQTNMRELQRSTEKRPTITGPLERGYSLREVDSQYRHGAPAVYDDCAPTHSFWVHVDQRDDDSTISDTIGIVMKEPDANGAAFISLVAHDTGMRDALLGVAASLSSIVRRLTRAHLLAISHDLIDDPLAAVADYEP